MGSFATTTIITSILSFGLAIFVYKKNNQSELNRSWFWVSLLMGFWSFGLWGVVRSRTEIEALAFQEILDLSAIFIPLLYFRFTTHLLNQTEVYKRQYYLLWIVSLIFAGLSFTPFFKVGMVPLPDYGFNFWINTGKIYFLFPIYFSVIMLYSFGLDLFYYKKLNPLARNQVRFILFAGLAGYLGGATNFFPQLIHVYPIGNYFVILYIVLVAYAIIRYRLMGIRTIISKIYIYFFVAVFAFTSFYLIILLDEIFWGGAYAPQSMLFSPIFSLAFALFFLPFFKKIQQTSDVLFFQGYNPKAILKDLALKLSSVIEIDELLQILNDEFKKILATEEIDVFFIPKNQKAKDYCISVLKNRSKTLRLGGQVCQKLLEHKKSIIRDEAENAGLIDLVKELDQIKAEVVSPLVIRQEVIGLIVLGEKIEQSPYTKEDIDFLQIISSQAAVAIENARLYQQVEDFNKNLQKKVDEQTKELRDKAEHMRKLMEMRSEFLDITSHQLRTPVTVIKGVLSMIEEGSIPPKKRKEFLRGAFEKSIKLGEIINDILRASEMDSEKFNLNVKPTDLNEILKRIQQDKIRTAEMKKIQLLFKLPQEPLPLVLGDEKYLEQAIVNLINNSFQYTAKGSVEVLAEVTKKNVIIRVADTGIGIPKKDFAKLFQKFARAQNAVSAYTDGSGLGLFIIKNIIDAIPGASIKIEKTEVDKGTTFAMTLPLAKAETPVATSTKQA
ncbi:MAG: ATP-binding protein [Candidatus Falkowbacteria bacterium]